MLFVGAAAGAAGASVGTDAIAAFGVGAVGAVALAVIVNPNSRVFCCYLVVLEHS